jgi:hypothetical protein
MFNPESDLKVKELCNLELQQAVRQWGEKYENFDVADSVLLEEIKEAKIEVRGIETAFIFWLASLNGDPGKQKKTVNVIQKLAENGIKELAQVWAVCEKIKKSF